MWYCFAVVMRRWGGEVRGVGFQRHFFLGGSHAGILELSSGLKSVEFVRKRSKMPLYLASFHGLQAFSLLSPVSDLMYSTIFQPFYSSSLIIPSSKTRLRRAFFLFRCFPLSELIQLIKPRGPNRPILPSLLSTHNLLY